MPVAHNTKLVAHIDCPGGGQVWVDGTTLYVGHMRPPSGTTVVDVADPKRSAHARDASRCPRAGTRTRCASPTTSWSSTTRSSGKDERGRVRRRPRHLRRVEAAPRRSSSPSGRPTASGVHRFDFDGRYAYISPTAEGYVGNIMHDPRPRRSGEAGGGRPLVDSRPVEGRRRGVSVGRAGSPPRCHHPLRMGDRLYVSYWHHGFYILDISDMCEAEADRRRNTSPAFPHPTHTCLPIPEPLKGRRHHGGGRRGRGQAVARAAGLHLDLRHHQRARCRCRSRPSRSRGSTPTARRSRR